MPLHSLLNPQPITRRAFLTQTAMTLVSTPFIVSCANFNQRVIFGNRLSESAVGCSGATLFSDQGPYYKTGAPERTNMMDDDPTTAPIVVMGQIFDTNCNPLPGAKIDFWQASGRGQYDNVGYQLRSHQLTDAEGRYLLETVVPGIYPARDSAHIHAKVFGANGKELLTTQIYFYGLSDQNPDWLFRESLLAEDLEPDKNGRRRVQFDIVVRT